MTSNEAAARCLAEDFRQQNGLDLAPVKDVFELVHATRGVDVISMDAHESEHGLSMLDPDSGRVVIVVATTSNPMRQRSSVAHELGHVLAGDLERDVTLVPGDRAPEEIRADAFARHLLLPLEVVRTRFPRGTEITAAGLSNLVQEFELSPKIVAIQLREAKLIDEQKCEFWGALSAPQLATANGWLSQYRALVDGSQRSRAPQALMSRAVAAYQQGLLGLPELAAWYGQPAEELAEALGTPEDLPAIDDDWHTDAPLFGDAATTS